MRLVDEPPVAWRTTAESGRFLTGRGIDPFVLGALGTGIAYVLNYRIIADGGLTISSTVT